ncbi:MAG: hypothetical protein P8P25_00200, partial [Flavobacteriaceae bacterium]|nr:hypothetical protein [Flavobacteriaceae bacterium]
GISSSFKIIVNCSMKKQNDDNRDKLEKLIYSVKYLPSVLYFGSLAWIAYSIYTQIYFGYEYNDLFDTLFLFWFLYITYLATKNYKKKN